MEHLWCPLCESEIDEDGMCYCGDDDDCEDEEVYDDYYQTPFDYHD